ncbi:type I glyceraldehyde-3-phosphate dehydrogenase [Litoreibacter arenae]|uniref:NAD-dependent glyceraldehyde-3-phosphate dehydrogenase n=1 Tax=Litoreibacter arenae DSM 19593 TaxID=1123360 RepID=S9RZM7_9RHOB|nr:glyceraldehyde 3-phosphate dehydrogenase NAD-binding domain-containing protein [Litoreibacter arenae]EPX79439.1 NAD-dependent glyceraldehyde-3-phosphate dehydrogenase [Litoreibacter arenae DSM 19593]
MARIAINGLGRIGRSILRLLTTTPAGGGFEIVALNDIARPELCAYLLRHDSVFGQFPGEVTHDDHSLTINGKRYPLTDNPDLSEIDLNGVDLVLECTGKSNSREFAERGLRAGAGRVLISGPCPTADQTVVIGANDDMLADQPIISCASCTTNALAPLARVIDDAFGLVTAHMTTIHCYTGSQPTVDAPRGDLVRSRAAALSMVPTTTSAGKLTDLVLPDLAGRIFATSVRVPTASVSAIDMSFQAQEPFTEEKINATLVSAKGSIIGITEEALVSSDLRARPESIVMALPETHVTKSGGMARVFGWYDNEWGFSNRMIDLARRMTKM